MRNTTKNVRANTIPGPASRLRWICLTRLESRKMPDNVPELTPNMNVGQTTLYGYFKLVICNFKAINLVLKGKIVVNLYVY